MQSGAADSRNSTAGHQPGAQLANLTGWLMFDDQRLRGWSLSQSGGTIQISAPGWISASAISGAGKTVNTWYYYAVCSVSGSSQSTASRVASAYPTSVSANIGVSWSSVTQSTAYRLYESSGTAYSTNFDY